MSKKKILYVASTASHLNRFHRPYLQALAERFDVRTMANGDGVDYPIPFEKQMFSVRNLRAVFQIRKILRRERFDLILVHTSLAAALTRMAVGGIKPRPYLMNVVHGYLFSDPPKGMKDRLLIACEKLLRNRTDAVAVMNETDLEIAGRRQLYRQELFFLHGMGLPEREAPIPDAELRRQFAPGETDFLMTFVGEFSRRKNQIFLIEAVSRLRKEELPVKLLLLGEGDEREKLTELVKKQNLGDAIFLPGSRDPVQPYLAVTDLYVSASRSEGLPFNLLEAMQCELPIVASRVRGQTDLLSEMPDSLYEPDDMESFCAAVRQALEKPHGPGSVSYPNLKRYLLSTVFEENMKLFTKGV